MSDHMAALAGHGGISDAVRIAQDCADLRPTALLIADDDAASVPAALLEQMGARLLGEVPLAGADEKLGRMVAVDAIVLRCPRSDAQLTALIPALVDWMSVNETALIVSVGMEALDLAYFLLQSSDALLLCEPTDLELATAIAVALRMAGARPELQDIGRESDIARLQRLSQDASWLAGRLSDTRPAAVNGGLPGHEMLADRHSDYRVEPVPGREAAPSEPASRKLTESRVRAVIRARRLRAKYIDAALFADPAWDMILDLLAAGLGGKRVSVSSLCIAAAVPPTTALRWISVLSEQGVVRREADPSDGRRVFIALADEMVASLTRWFAEAEPLLCSALDPAGDRA